MKYSIILPVKNGGEYVKECVNSVLSQTLQDFNLIILDNRSTDGTSQWLQSLNNKKIIIYPSDKPLSIEENWARIKDVPKNEFITLIGHDDILLPDFLGNIDRLLNQYPSAGLYHTHFNFIDANGKVIRSCKKMAAFYSYESLLEAFMQRSIDSMGTGYVMRSEDYNRLKGIPVRYPNLLFADFELWLLLTSKGGMAVSSNTSFAFRVHKSTTGASDDKKMQMALEIFVKFLVEQKSLNNSVNTIVENNAVDFLLDKCQSLSHRMLRTSINLRGDNTVDSFIVTTEQWAKELGIEGAYFPYKKLQIKLASIIDSNSILRSGFLLFKKLFKKPIL